MQLEILTSIKNVCSMRQGNEKKIGEKLPTTNCREFQIVSTFVLMNKQ